MSATEVARLKAEWWDAQAVELEAVNRTRRVSYYAYTKYKAAAEAFRDANPGATWE
jgi:hypothetical protein